MSSAHEQPLVAPQFQHHLLARLDVLHGPDQIPAGTHRLTVDGDDIAPKLCGFTAFVSD